MMYTIDRAICPFANGEYSMPEYSEKIKLEPNGSYTWMCAIDPAFYRGSIKPGLYACLGITVFILVFGGILSYKYNDREIFLIVAGCAGVFLLITAFFFGLAFKAEHPRETYVMSDIYIRSGYGRSAVFFHYDKARMVVITGKYIELQGKTTKMRVYTPEEDFPFISNYILNRLPGDCERRYEWSR